MVRVVQFAFVLVVLLVMRHVFYAWLKQPDALTGLLKQGLNAILLYFAYVMVGLVGFSALAGRGFGKGSEVAAVLLTLGGAAYVGLGIGALWLYLAKHDPGPRKR